MADLVPATESHHDLLVTGRLAISQGAWAEAQAAFAAAVTRRETPEALEGLAAASLWMGEWDPIIPSLERAFQLYRAQDDRRGAARVAALVAEGYADLRGDHAVARGWLERGWRLLENEPPCAELGWMALFGGHYALMIERDPVEARRLASEGVAVGRTIGLLDVEVVGRALEGLALVSEGRVRQGMRHLDEAAAAAVAGELGEPRAFWTACCYLISGCEKVRDYERAAQWCSRVSAFCERWGLRTLFAACRTHYASLLIWQGVWAEAEAELQASRLELEARWPSNAGSVFSRLGELRRRQGRWEEARSLFSRVEHHPIALLGRASLALDEGDDRTAGDLLDRLLRKIAQEDRTDRTAALELAVRLHLHQGKVEAAETALTELQAVADLVGTGPLRGAARLAAGRVSAWRSDLMEARRAFEDAGDLFAGSGAPYEEAVSRLELAQVLAVEGRSTGARESAGRARDALERLGAAREAARAAAFLAALGSGTAGPAVVEGSKERSAADAPGAEERWGATELLTRREVEILRLVAKGLTNQQIAARLFISPHTVHRHLANIRRKMGVPTRAAAAAAAVAESLL